MEHLDKNTLNQIFYEPLNEDENTRLASLIEHARKKKAFSQ